MSATAARRAVGKAAFSQKGKDQCYEAINTHFGEDPKSAKEKKTRPAADKPRNLPPHQVNEAAVDEIDLANRRVGTITQALEALKAAKEASPDVDTKAGAAAATAALTDIMRGVHTSVLGGPNPKSNGLGTSTAHAEHVQATTVAPTPS
jgi:hypothetical protein